MVASEFEPGMRVKLLSRTDWGLGQVQSVIGQKVTVTFEHAGKQVVHSDRARLIIVEDDDRS